MMRNSQTYLCKTEYVELLALFYLSEIFPDVDFYKVAKERKNRNAFPDWIIGNRWVEVTRAINAIQGKQQKAVTKFFSSKVLEETYYHDDKCQTSFAGNENGHVAMSVSESEDMHTLQICEAIREKALKCSKKIIPSGNALDLFVIHYQNIDYEHLNVIQSFIKDLKANPFENVFLHCLVDPNEDQIFEFTENGVKKYPISQPPSKDGLCDLLFELGWLKKRGQGGRTGKLKA